MKDNLPSAIMPQQPTNLTQNFQLAPNSQNNMRFANTIDDVIREVVYVDTPFFSRDMSVLWIKNSKNEIKSFELKEIVQKDEKDMKIEFLMAQIEELKKGSVNNEFTSISKNDTYDDESTQSKKPYNGKTNSRNDK